MSSSGSDAARRAGPGRHPRQAQDRPGRPARPANRPRPTAEADPRPTPVEAADRAEVDAPRSRPLLGRAHRRPAAAAGRVRQLPQAGRARPAGRGRARGRRACWPTLLPVLDDIDRARAHGDLTGAFKAVADKLDGVAGQARPERVRRGRATRSTRRPRGGHARRERRRHRADVHDGHAPGYQHGERLLRPAMVGVDRPGRSPRPTSTMHRRRHDRPRAEHAADDTSERR